MRDSACRSDNPTVVSNDDFFSGDKEAQRRAKEICQTCSVRSECLAHCLKLGAVGVWGGTTDDDRRRMIRLASH